jgi:hypothetical protein
MKMRYERRRLAAQVLDFSFGRLFPQSQLHFEVRSSSQL